MSTIEFDALPFFWRVRDRIDEPNIIGDHMPFAFDERQDLGLLCQRLQPDVVRALELVYRANANIGYLQDNNPLASPYGKDFLSFLDRHLGVDRHVVAEIGCGGCYVLSELKRRGHEVVGIDPSPVAQQAGQKKHINVIESFYPSASTRISCDAVVHMNVLEHVTDPVAFLNSHREHLAADGLVVVGVPDCSESIVHGDISIAMHEHFNYFDKDSLVAVAIRAGFRVIEVAKSGYGGSLYAALSPDRGHGEHAARGQILATFQDRAQRLVQRIEKFIQGSTPVGFYVPLRALPYVTLLKTNDAARFFDDAAHWHGKFFDGFRTPIENMSDLLAMPVSKMLICSLTFGDVIRDRLISNGIAGLDAKRLGDFL